MTSVVPVVRRPDYVIGLELCADLTFAHTTIRRWTAQIARAWRRDADLLFSLHGGPMLAASHQPHADDAAKFARFCEWAGFMPHLSMPWADGVERPVYIRRS